MGKVRWKLKQYLEKHNLTAYRLAQTLGTRGRMPTIYRLAREGEEPSRVDLPTLANVIDGLRELTGEDVQVSDLLEYEEKGR
ncbi:MAG: helix-turn-helix transcriptional regulator [Deinococcota bacterium]|jgi:predicted ArsR family transcriptional regulator|nr:helix-turn-helix transcriptional regulator [Deinococcota bacterium]